ncbi:hypothetical protein EBR78_10175 [bacterium]|nr:hypothetical protein [bacterium]
MSPTISCPLQEYAKGFWSIFPLEGSKKGVNLLDRGAQRQLVYTLISRVETQRNPHLGSRKRSIKSIAQTGIRFALL